MTTFCALIEPGNQSHLLTKNSFVKSRTERTTGLQADESKERLPLVNKKHK